MGAVIDDWEAIEAWDRGGLKLRIPLAVYGHTFVDSNIPRWFYTKNDRDAAMCKYTHGMGAARAARLVQCVHRHTGSKIGRAWLYGISVHRWDAHHKTAQCLGESADIFALLPSGFVRRSAMRGVSLARVIAETRDVAAMAHVAARGAPEDFNENNCRANCR